MVTFIQQLDLVRKLFLFNIIWFYLNNFRQSNWIFLCNIWSLSDVPSYSDHYCKFCEVLQKRAEKGESDEKEENSETGNMQNIESKYIDWIQHKLAEEKSRLSFAKQSVDNSFIEKPESDAAYNNASFTSDNLCPDTCL